MTDVQLIKDHLDIVQLIQEYVPLKKAGVNWKANCPFHQEKSPSFMVHPEKQIWHCFGCGKGGDLFSFIQEIEGLDFLETLKILAPRAGVSLTTTSSEMNQSQKNRLWEINAKAAYFFHHFLLEMSASSDAREYLKKRGLDQETISNWQIGYVPNQWNLLTHYLLKKGYSINDLVAAGLTIQKDNADFKTGRGCYDRFRGRIMFPLADVHGNIIGFTGRVLTETEHSGGKYVNTPQTLIYDKSRILYGLYKAKTDIKSKNVAIIVEGQMDVVACHQFGIKNVVAASGTALTSEQVKLIKRYTNNIAIAFDADNAGENAGKRGIEVALSQGLNIKIIQIPSSLGKDADECIRKDLKSWLKAMEDALDIMDWYFVTTFKKHNSKDPKDRQTIATILLEQIARLPYAVERDHWLKRLGEMLQVDRIILQEEMRKIKKSFASTSSASAAKTENYILSMSGSSNRYQVLLQAFWALLFKTPSLYEECREALKTEYFKGTFFADLYGLWQTYYNNGQIDFNALNHALNKQNFENITNVLALQGERDYAHLTIQECSEEIKKLVRSIKEEWVKFKRKELEVSLREAEKEGDKQVVNLILQNIQSL